MQTFTQVLNDFPTTGLPSALKTREEGQREWYAAAALADVPRMMYALEHGARASRKDDDGATAASWFARSFGDERAHILSDDQYASVWRWLSEKGVPLYEKGAPHSPFAALRRALEQERDATPERVALLEQQIVTLWHLLPLDQKREEVYTSATSPALCLDPLLHALREPPLDYVQECDAFFFIAPLTHTAYYTPSSRGVTGLGGVGTLFSPCRFIPSALCQKIVAHPEARACLDSLLLNVCTDLSQIEEKIQRSGRTALSNMLQTRLALCVERFMEAGMRWSPATAQVLSLFPPLSRVLERAHLKRALPEGAAPQGTLRHRL